MSAPQRTSGGRRGANAIEFALTLPVVLAITLGAVDYGWLFAVVQQAQAAAQDGARAGAQVDPDDPALDAEAVAAEASSERLGTSFPASDMDAVVDASLTGGGTRLVVTVSVTFEPLVGFVPVPRTWTATAERYVEAD